MAAQALIARLRALDIHLSLVDGRLRCDAPAGMLGPELRAEIAAQKPALLALLSEAPLSPAQRQLWLICRLHPDQPIYNESCTLRLGARVDADAMQRALSAMVERHASLRTTFHEASGEPFQRIGSPSRVPLPSLDLRTRPVPDREAEFRRVATEMLQAPYDLETGPLLRALLVHDADDDRLFVAFHHLAMDGISLFQIFAPELAATYEAFVRGAVPELLPVDGPRSPLRGPPPARASCAELARLSARPDPARGEHLAWWRAALRDVPPAAPPPDRPAPPTAARSWAGAQHTFVLPPPLTAGIDALARRCSTTPFFVLLAGITALLQRHTGQDTFALGTVTAGRGDGELDRTLGHFIRTLVLPLRVEGEPTVRELLDGVRDITLDAWAHDALPFDELVAELAEGRREGQNPLFHVAFVFEPKADRGAPWRLERWDVHAGVAKFDLLVEIEERADGFAVRLEHNLALYTPATIERLAHHLTLLLAAMVEAPDRPLAALPMLTAPELDQLRAWNATTTPFAAVPVHHLVEAQVSRTPDAVAVRDGAVRLSYRDLDARANQLAHRLRALGVGPDAPVGLCLDRSADQMIAILAVLKAGGAYVPLDVSYPEDRLATMLADAGARALVTQAALAPRLPPSDAPVVCIDGDAALLDAEPVTAPDVEVGPDHLAYIIYTSGSTGRPKGVAMHHRPLANLLAWQLRESAAGAGTRTLQLAPVSFDVSFQEIFSTWCSGGTLVLIPEASRRDARAVLALLVEHAVERLFLPFVALRQLSEVALLVGPSPTALREVITAGEQLQITPAIAAFFARLPGCTLHNHYGPSETHVVSSHTLSGAPSSWPALPPIGRPIANAGLHVLDRRRRPVPVGVTGELFLSGVALARGYHGRPDLTADRFLEGVEIHGTRQRLYRTGDLARRRADGEVEFLGRGDDQLKIRGYRVEPGEVEVAIARSPSVREVKVVAYEERPAGERSLAAYVVPHAGAAENEASLLATLRAELGAALPEYMIPTAFFVLEAMPLTPSGKVDTRALPALGTRPLPASCVAPRDALELELLQIWSDLFSAPNIGVRDDFFDCGGHSLLAVRLMAQIQRRFGRALPLSALFGNGTVERLATLLRDGGRPSTSPLVRIQEGAGARPFFCVPGSGGNVIYLRELARSLGAARPFIALQPPGADGRTAPHRDFVALAAHHVEALRAEYPQGPYLLGGHSTGGCVAFEMARQLEALGQEVAGVALLDIPAPREDNTIGHGWDDVRWLTSIAELLGRLAGRDLGLQVEELHARDSESRLAYLQERMAESDILPPGAGLDQVRAIVRLMIESDMAYARYRPAGPCRAPVLLLRAAEVYENDQLGVLTAPSVDPTWGWGRHCTSPVQVRTVPGDHLSMMTAPNVESLARGLGAFLGG